MPSLETCPNEAEMLAVAAGDEPGAGLSAHLAECSRCREQLEQLKVAVGYLRGEAGREHALNQ